MLTMIILARDGQRAPEGQAVIVMPLANPAIGAGRAAQLGDKARRREAQTAGDIGIDLAHATAHDVSYCVSRQYLDAARASAAPPAAVTPMAYARVIAAALRRRGIPPEASLKLAQITPTQLLQPAALGPIAEHDLPEGGTVHRGCSVTAAAGPHPLTKALQHRRGPGAPRRQGLTGVHVRIQYGQPLQP